MQLRRCLSALASGLLPLLLCAACTGGHAATRSEPATRSPLALRILDGTQFSSGSFRLERSRIGGSELLELYAYGLNEMSSLYIAIPLAEDAGQLSSSLHTELDDASPLSLQLVHDGELQFGWVAMDKPFSADGRIASFRLDQPGPGTPRTASKAVPAVADLSRNARWNILSWSYLNPGDYDQNGIVSISDLTPLGQNFGATGPFASDSAQWIVDGDGNGEINLADISVIGQNFGNTVSAYELWASKDGSGYPNTGSARLVASIDTADSLGAPSERRNFRVSDLEVRLDDRYWVNAVSNNASSELTPAWERQWHSTTLFEFESSGGTTGAPRAAIIDGRPAAAWVVGNNGGRVHYCISENAAGTSWSSPVIVPSSSNINNSPWLLDIGGRPGIFHSVHNKGLCYFEGSDAEGSSWSTELQMNNEYNTYMEYAFQTGNSLHAITYRFTDHFILDHHGNAPLPTSFLPENPLAQADYVDATSDGNRLMIAYYDLLNMDARFAMFDASGPNLQPLMSMPISQEGDIVRFADLQLVNGLPRAWLVRGNPQRLYELRATTAEATTWTAGQLLDFGLEYYTSMQFMAANGGLWAYDQGPASTGLLVHHSPSGEIADWEDLPILEAGVSGFDLLVGGIISVRGNTAILYTDYTTLNKRFIYSVFY
ncbi:MAG: hypothetical protein H7A35_05415 [Planctomycetales bacterium]|nr:hypothetical protein [bacterium]UNM09496.1 MAG: hypothetical protein H7A35_05415 [Planctomycetales bacterium]